MRVLRTVAFALTLAIPTLAISLGALAGTPGTITPTSDDRFVNAFGDPDLGDGLCGPTESDTETPLAPFTPFTDSVSAGDGGFASQDSSVGTGVLSGTGFASGFSDFCFGVGNSTYDVSFSLSGPTQLDLTGSLEVFDSFGFGFAETTARLTRSATVVYEAVADPFSGSVPLSFSGVVPAGTYRLFVEADGDVSIEASWDFTLDADPGAPVPALGPGALAALGLLLAASGLRGIRRG